MMSSWSSGLDMALPSDQDAPMPIDHTACTHPRTKAGRAACRRANAAETPANAEPLTDAELAIIRADRAIRRTRRDRTKVLADGTIRMSADDAFARISTMTPEELVWLDLRAAADTILPQFRGDLDMLLARIASAPNSTRRPLLQKATELRLAIVQDLQDRSRF